MTPSLVWMMSLIPLAAQNGGPEIVNPGTTYGYLGAPRPKMGFLPGDVAHVSFGIKKLKADAKGKVAYSVAIVIKDDAGKLIFEQRPFNAVAQNFFGGDILPASARIEVPVEIKPGAVHWEVTVEDRNAGKKTSLKGAGKILAPDFGIIHVGTFADPDNKVPIAPTGVAGSHLHLHFALTGYTQDKVNKQPDVEVQLRILDDKGEPTMPQPMTGRINKDIDPEHHLVPIDFGLTLGRPGRFTIEISARDMLGNKRAQVTLPVRVVAME